MALLLHKKEPAFWNGAVLVAPMCKVKQFAPNFQVGFLLLNFAKTHCLVPSNIVRFQRK